MNIEELKKKRFRYLKKVYDETEGDRYTPIDMWRLGRELGWDREETRKIVDYLIAEGLIEPAGIGGLISMAHEGVKEVELALENPRQPTEHFPPVNIINIEKMVNSQIQQSTKESLQKQSITKEVNVGGLTEAKKKGYVAGAISIVACVFLAVMVVNFGWNLTGQILTTFAAFFGLLGIGSLIKPESFGQVTLQILENISRDHEED